MFTYLDAYLYVITTVVHCVAETRNITQCFYIFIHKRKTTTNHMCTVCQFILKLKEFFYAFGTKLLRVKDTPIKICYSGNVIQLKSIQM